MAEQHDDRVVQGVGCSEHGVHERRADASCLVVRVHADRAEPECWPAAQRADRAHDMADHHARVAFGDQRQGRHPADIVTKPADERDLDRLGPRRLGGERGPMDGVDAVVVGFGLSADQHDSLLFGRRPWWVSGTSLLHRSLVGRRTRAGDRALAVATRRAVRSSDTNADQSGDRGQSRRR